MIKEQFLSEQMTSWHNQEILQSILANEIGRVNHVPWNAVPNDKSDVELGKSLKMTRMAKYSLLTVDHLKYTSAVIQGFDQRL